MFPRTFLCDVFFPSARADGMNVVIFVDELSADAVFETVSCGQIA